MMDELKKIDLNLLVTLHALLAEKHVTRAALRLNKSQPAVSHALSQLRLKFDDPILVRNAGRLEITARAQQLIKPLEQALGDLNILLSNPKFDPMHANARFRLALSDYAARIILPMLVRKVRNEAPGVELAISQGSRDVMALQLINGEIDLALGIFPTIPANIHLENLFRDQFTCFAEQSVLSLSDHLTLDDWLKRPHVAVSLHPDAIEEIDEVLASRKLRRNIVLTLPHWSAALDVISGTDLILTIARRAVTDLGRHKTLQEFTPPFDIPELTYQQAWHSRRDHDLSLSWLRNVIHQSCDESEEYNV